MQIATFEISIKGEIDPEYARAFAPSDVILADGRTVIRAAEVDRAALHGLLAQIADMGLDLLEVRRVDGSGSGTASE